MKNKKVLLNLTNELDDIKINEAIKILETTRIVEIL